MGIKASPDARDTIGGRSLKTFKSVIERIGVLAVKAMLYALCEGWVGRFHSTRHAL